MSEKSQVEKMGLPSLPGWGKDGGREAKKSEEDPERKRSRSSGSGEPPELEEVEGLQKWEEADAPQRSESSKPPFSEQESSSSIEVAPKESVVQGGPEGEGGEDLSLPEDPTTGDAAPARAGFPDPAEEAEKQPAGQEEPGSSRGGPPEEEEEKVLAGEEEAGRREEPTVAAGGEEEEALRQLGRSLDGGGDGEAGASGAAGGDAKKEGDEREGRDQQPAIGDVIAGRLDETDPDLWPVPDPAMLLGDEDFPSDEDHPNLNRLYAALEGIDRAEILDKAIEETGQALAMRWQERIRKPYEALSEEEVLAKVRMLCIHSAVNARRADEELMRTQEVRQDYMEREVEAVERFEKRLTKVSDEIGSDVSERAREEIAAFQKKIGEAVDKMESRLQSLAEGEEDEIKKRVEAVQNAFEDYSLIVDEAAERFGRLKRESEEAMENVEDMYDTTAGSVRELKDSTEGLRKAADEIGEAAEHVKQSAWQTIYNSAAGAFAAIVLIALFLFLVTRLMGGVSLEFGDAAGQTGEPPGKAGAIEQVSGKRASGKPSRRAAQNAPATGRDVSGVGGIFWQTREVAGPYSSGI